MAHYALFLPNKTGSDPKHLDSVGLESLRRDAGPECATVVEHSPAGNGVIALWRSGDASHDEAFDPRCYEWKPAKADKARGLASKRFWLGVPTKRPMTPRDIERRTTHAGYVIELCDKNGWLIPAAEKLPHRYGLDDDGEFTRSIAPEWASYFDRSTQYAVEFFAAIDQLDRLQAVKPNAKATPEVKFTLADTWAFACEALAINYRLCPEIIDLLGLLDDQCLRNIVKAAIDLPVLLETRIQKKTAELTIPVG